MVYNGIYKETHVITVIVFWGFFSLYNPTEAIHLLLWRSPRDTAQRGRSQPPLISKCQSLLKGLAAEVH